MIIKNHQFYHYESLWITIDAGKAMPCLHPMTGGWSTIVYEAHTSTYWGSFNGYTWYTGWWGQGHPVLKNRTESQLGWESQPNECGNMPNSCSNHSPPTRSDVIWVICHNTHNVVKTLSWTFMDFLLGFWRVILEGSPHMVQHESGSCWYRFR